MDPNLLSNYENAGGIAQHEVTPVADPIAWHADAQWALQQWEKGNFEFGKGEYFAVYDKTILGYGDDPNQLRRLWSQLNNVPFQRIFVKYIGTEEHE